MIAVRVVAAATANALDVVDWSLNVGDWSVLIVVVIGVISVAAMVVPVIGHGISDCCTANPTHDRTDRTANSSSGDGAPHASSDRAAFVGISKLR